MDVLECQEQNGLVSFKQNFLTPNDDGGGLDPTNWGGTTYEHTYSPLEEDCVHFHPNLNYNAEGLCGKIFIISLLTQHHYET